MKLKSQPGVKRRGRAKGFRLPPAPVPVMSPIQCACARAVLNWSRAYLAQLADVGVMTVSRFELSYYDPGRSRTVRLMKAAFEKAGIEFIENGIRWLPEYDRETLRPKGRVERR